MKFLKKSTIWLPKICAAGNHHCSLKKAWRGSHGTLNKAHPIYPVRSSIWTYRGMRHVFVLMKTPCSTFGNMRFVLNGIGLSCFQS